MPLQNKKSSTYSSIKSILASKQKLKPANQYITREFQDFGYQIAEKLGDLPHKALYIKMAKMYPRSLLDSAMSFVSDYPKAQNKGRLFMWKIKQLKGLMKTTPTMGKKDGGGDRKSLE
ncbi:MAG: hypothetical protein WCJ19_03460 [bacterium]